LLSCRWAMAGGRVGRSAGGGTLDANMVFSRVALIAQVSLLLAVTGSGQDFSYPDFSNMTGLTVNANAAQAGTVLRLTPSANNQVGSCFYNLPTQVAAGFTCTFTFQIDLPTGGGADGMAFVVHNAAQGLSAIGDSGSGLGYALNSNQSIENSLVVEFDTWNSGLGDPSDNHVSIHTCSTSANRYPEDFSIGMSSVSSTMSDGNVHTAIVAYDGLVLEVFVDDLVTPLISAPWDFTTGGTYVSGNSVGGLNLMAGGTAYVGFSAATGGAAETHDVLSWDWSGGDGPVGTNYCSPANINSSGLSAIMSGWGRKVVTANSLTLTASAMPTNEFGYFLCGQTQGFNPNPGGSQGTLCLSGKIGRFSKQLQSSGGAGAFTINVDLTALPVWRNQSVLPGETWHFQAWFKDGASSNFTDGLSVLFQ